MTVYYKMRQILLQNPTATLLQNATEVYYKMRQGFYYKMRRFYYKMRRLLQIETVHVVCCINFKIVQLCHKKKERLTSLVDFNKKRNVGRKVSQATQRKKCVNNGKVIPVVKHVGPVTIEDINDVNKGCKEDVYQTQ